VINKKIKYFKINWHRKADSIIFKRNKKNIYI
jgi:hypothetical protein